jgi:hypothetical protein
MVNISAGDIDRSLLTRYTCMIVFRLDHVERRFVKNRIDVRIAEKRSHVTFEQISWLEINENKRRLHKDDRHVAFSE